VLESTRLLMRISQEPKRRVVMGIACSIAAVCDALWPFFFWRRHIFYLHKFDR
jgi:hypothetical protein